MNDRLDKGAEGLEIEEMLDEIFLSSLELRNGLKGVFTGSESIEVLISAVPKDEQGLVKRISQLDNEGWGRVKRVLAPEETSSPENFGKASGAVQNEAATRLRWYLEGRMLHTKVDVNVHSIFGDTLMHHAAKCRGMVKILLEYGSAVDPRTINGITPLMGISSFEDGTEEIDLLISNGARINAHGFEGKTVLHNICNNFNGESTEEVEYLLKAGANPNALDINGNTSRHLVELAKQDFHMHPDPNSIVRGKIGKCVVVIEMLRIAEGRKREQISSKKAVSQAKVSTPESKPSSEENEQIISKLKTLKSAFEQGLLTQGEYDAKKQKLIEDL